MRGRQAIEKGRLEQGGAEGSGVAKVLPDFSAVQNDQGTASSDDEGDVGASEAAYYDPAADEADESWVAAHRTGHVSDAVLSCPACFATLCIDCQQHDLYPNQFRAMFVTNCKKKEGEILRAPPVAARQGRGRKRGRRKEGTDDQTGTAGAPPMEVFLPVQCADCGTEVAVLDADEVYHFFNVLPAMA